MAAPTTSFRPQEIDLLVAVTKSLKVSDLKFDDFAEQVGISVSAASQRWGRLRNKIIGNKEITLKTGDELGLLVAIAKQWDGKLIDFDEIGTELGINKSATSQRWARLKTKIRQADSNENMPAPEKRASRPSQSGPSGVAKNKKSKGTRVNKAAVKKGVAQKKTKAAMNEDGYGSSDEEEIPNTPLKPVEYYNSDGDEETHAATKKPLDDGSYEGDEEMHPAKKQRLASGSSQGGEDMPTAAKKSLGSRGYKGEEDNVEDMLASQLHQDQSRLESPSPEKSTNQFHPVNSTFRAMDDEDYEMVHSSLPEQLYVMPDDPDWVARAFEADIAYEKAQAAAQQDKIYYFKRDEDED